MADHFQEHYSLSAQGVPSDVYHPLFTIARQQYEPDLVRHWYAQILRQVRGMGDHHISQVPSGNPRSVSPNTKSLEDTPLSQNIDQRHPSEVADQGVNGRVMPGMARPIALRQPSNDLMWMVTIANAVDGQTPSPEGHTQASPSSCIQGPRCLETYTTSRWTAPHEPTPQNTPQDATQPANFKNPISQSAVPHLPVANFQDPSSGLPSPVPNVFSHTEHLQANDSYAVPAISPLPLQSDPYPAPVPTYHQQQPMTGPTVFPPEFDRQCAPGSEPLPRPPGTTHEWPTFPPYDMPITEPPGPLASGSLSPQHKSIRASGPPSGMTCALPGLSNEGGPSFTGEPGMHYHFTKSNTAMPVLVTLDEGRRSYTYPSMTNYSVASRMLMPQDNLYSTSSINGMPQPSRKRRRILLPASPPSMEG